MSVVRGRPPGFAGGMNGSIRRYWSSLRAWPEPKSPTSARTSGVHIAASGKGVSPIRTAINITVHPRSNGGGCTFKTGSHQRTQHRAIILIQDRAKAASMRFRCSAPFLVQLAQPTANRTFRYFEAPGDRRLALLATLARAQHALA